MRVCFVIPTYNEAGNITPILERLSALYQEVNTIFLVVDDESQDGTAELVREFSASDSRVLLLSGRRRGLGDAYMRGIAHALDALEATAIVQMDADFSHDPADAARLLARLGDDADVVIGSRYVAGGSVDERWGVGRRLLSRWGNRLARWIGGIQGLHDCTAGFKVIKADALRAARFAEIDTRGHVFQVVLLQRLLRAGSKVVEEPIYFRDREHGQTKLGFWNLLEFFYTMLRLRLADSRTFLRFAFVGLSGIFVNLGIFQLLLEFDLDKFLVSPLAFEASVLWNFFLNNHWTFAGRGLHDRKRVRFLKYHLVSSLALGVGYGAFVALALLFPQSPLVLLQGCATLPSVLLNYVLNSGWTFPEGRAESQRCSLGSRLDSGGR